MPFSENKEKIVSIIIPVYNAEKYIDRCLKSILNQTFSNYEIILIDDGSTDSTATILDEYATRYNCIKVNHVENGGPSKARNIGLEMARGKWVQFMDADDFLESTMLEDYYNKSKQVDLIISGVIRDLVFENKKKESNLCEEKLENRNTIGKYLVKMNISQHDILLNYIWNKWYLREKLILNQIKFNEAIKWGEDYLFNCKVFEYIDSVQLLKKNYYHYCYNNNESLVEQFNKNERDLQDGMDKSLRYMLKSYAIDDICEEKIEINSGRCYYNSLMKLREFTNKEEIYGYIDSCLERGGKQKIIKFIKGFPIARKIKNLPIIFAVQTKSKRMLFYILKLKNKRRRTA